MMRSPHPSACLLALALSPLLSVTAWGDATAVPKIGLDGLQFLRSGDPLIDWNPHRVWTATDGRNLRANLLGLDGDQGRFALENGKRVTIPLDRLIEDDRRFIREWAAVSEYFNLAYTPSRSVTQRIEAGIFDGTFAKEGRVHETRHFRFECDDILSQEVVKDFSRLFEATYLAVQSHPLALALAKAEGDKYPVRLFSRDADYHAAGGSPQAAGVYLIQERVMLVPLSSLGLVLGSKGWRKSRDFDPRTLIHETTHALTHQWLAYAPMWFVEGFAEYIASIPYKDGVFDLSRHREGMLDLAAKKFHGDPSRFTLLEPREFVVLSHRAYMGEDGPEEPLLELPRVEPVQITLTARREEAPRPERPPLDREMAGGRPLRGNAPLAPPQSSFTPPLPRSRPPASIDTGRVLQRYVSSLFLMGEIDEKGQTEALRRYLFDCLCFEWDRRRYLDRYLGAYKAHQEAVRHQTQTFDRELQGYQATAQAYNQALAEHRRGEIGALPDPPAEPEIPKAIPVPEILREPRRPEALSRQRFLESAWQRHLRVDRLPPLPAPR